jgi:hypothetical protein
MRTHCVDNGALGYGGEGAKPEPAKPKPAPADAPKEAPNPEK